VLALLYHQDETCKGEEALRYDRYAPSKLRPKYQLAAGVTMFILILVSSYSTLAFHSHLPLGLHMVLRHRRLRNWQHYQVLTAIAGTGVHVHALEPAVM
jgi:hypothetical protein